MRTSRKFVIGMGAFTAVGVLFFTGGCSKSENIEAKTVKDADTAAVAVARVTTENLSREIVLTAEFRPFQEVEVMAKVAGYVKTIYVDVGDRVKKDQLLAVLEIPEMADDKARAEAAIDRAQAEVAHARDMLQQATSAHEITHLSYTRLDGVSKQKPGLIAQQEIDDARGKDMVAEAQVSGAKSNLAAAQQQVQVNLAELQRIKTMSDYTRVMAPFAGVVTKRFADTGSMIQAGTASNTQAMPLVRLSENSLLRLTLPVPESAVPTIHLGQQVEVLVPTLNRSFPGRVARFSDKVALSTRTMDTEVDVPNANLTLIPGMYAEVHLQTAHRDAPLVVPVTAVDGSGDNPAVGQVAVVTADNKVEFRKIELGLETANKVEVKSGLHDGDLVVVGSRSGLQQGQEVRPKLTGAGAQ